MKPSYATSADNPTSEIFQTINITPPVTSLNNVSRSRSTDEQKNRCSLWVTKFFVRMLRPFAIALGKFFEWVGAINLPLYLLGVIFTAAQSSKIPASLGPILLSVASITSRLKKGVQQISFGMNGIKKDIIDSKNELASQIEKTRHDITVILSGLREFVTAVNTAEADLSRDIISELRDIKKDMKEMRNQIGSLCIMVDSMREIKDLIHLISQKIDGKDKIVHVEKQLQAIQQDLTSIRDIIDMINKNFPTTQVDGLATAEKAVVENKSATEVSEAPMDAVKACGEAVGALGIEELQDPSTGNREFQEHSAGQRDSGAPGSFNRQSGVPGTFSRPTRF